VNRRILKQVLDGERETVILRFGNHLNAAHGVAAHLEEVVIDTDLFQSQNFTPEVCQKRLCMRARRNDVFA
jgi:hypothetical protein